MGGGDVTHLTYAERLRTFEGYWDDNEATSRQLAAIGHVYDRPPLEVLEEGSRCISCSAFVRRELSVMALEGNGPRTKSYEDGFRSFDFHHPSCTRLQVRIPLEPQAVMPGLYGGCQGRISDLKRRFEKNLPSANSVSIGTQRLTQKGSFFSLPTEVRLQVYALILPRLDAETEIVSLNRDSARVITSEGYRKTGPRDTTKSNILRSCRAINDEAMDLLYTNTVFIFASTKLLYLFLRNIGRRGCAVIKAVDVHCGGREDALAFALLATCHRLRALSIRLPRPALLFSRPPIWVVDGVACILSLRGLEKVTFLSGSSPLRYLRDEHADAVAVRKQLMSARGTATDPATMGKYLTSNS